MLSEWFAYVCVWGFHYSKRCRPCLSGLWDCREAKEDTSIVHHADDITECIRGRVPHRP